MYEKGRFKQTMIRLERVGLAAAPATGTILHSDRQLDGPGKSSFILTSIINIQIRLYKDVPKTSSSSSPTFNVRKTKKLNLLDMCCLVGSIYHGSIGPLNPSGF